MRTAKFLDSEGYFVVRTNPGGADFRLITMYNFKAYRTYPYEQWAMNARNGDMVKILNDKNETTGYIRIEDIDD